MVEQHLDIRRNYAAMIENIDRWVGHFVASLQANGQIDDTVVIYTSDHGEMLGDRGLWEKHVPFHASVHVPLILAGGSFWGDLRVSRAVSLLDLTATLRSVAGVEVPEGTSGAALEPHEDELLGNGRVVTSGLGNWRLAFDGRYKLVIGYDPALPRRKIPSSPFAKGGRTLLYDLVEDPWERHDIGDARHDILDRLRGHVDQPTA